MSVVQALPLLDVSETHFTTSHPWWRSLALALAVPWLFIFLSVTAYVTSWPLYYLTIYKPL